MFNEENYEKIFTQRLNHKNIDVIRKFFIFPFNKNAHIKPFSSLVIKNSENMSVKKNNNPKYVGGFQLYQKTMGYIQPDEQKAPLSSIAIKSKRLPLSSAETFLEKLTHKINKEI